jgi:signal transduction histidine kinase
LQSVRRLAVELRPNALDDFGLVAAVERLAETVRDQGSLEVDVAAQLGADRLPPEVETALYRIVQEALTNVVKHAQARRVSVLLMRRNDVVSAVIEDDGRGLARSDNGEGGIGLLGMKERLDLLDGRLQVESSEGAGTTVVAEVPL